MRLKIEGRISELARGGSENVSTWLLRDVIWWIFENMFWIKTSIKIGFKPTKFSRFYWQPY